MKYTGEEQQLLGNALEALAKETGMTARVLDREARLDRGKHRLDAVVEVATTKQTYNFAVEIRNNLDRFETLHQLRALLPPNHKQTLLIVAPYISQQLAERCRELDMCFADTAGNAYLHAPGLHVYITGRPKPPELRAADSAKAMNAAGLRVVFALLCQPHLLNATYREIAATAQVALGTVGQAFKYLENRRHITAQAAEGNRRFLAPERTLQEWVTLYPTVLRPKLHARRFRTTVMNWTEGVDLEPYRTFWGGEVAANRLDHYLQPQTATIYAPEMPTKLIVDQRMKADVNGNTEILGIFWNPERLTPTGDVVPPVLAYADLMATTEGRNLEAGKLIYDKHIEPLFRNQA